MKNLRTTTLVLLTWILNACSLPANSLLLDSQGNKISPSTWQNKWVVINYWAGWCKPCVEEIPELNRFYHSHSKNSLVFGVNYDQLPLLPLRTAILEMHIVFPVLQKSPVDTFSLPEVNVVPTTFIINPHGQLVKKLIGPQTSNGLEEVINELSQSP